MAIGNASARVEALAEDGRIEPETPEVGPDVSIDVRQDDLRMFETAEGELLLTTPDTEVFISAVPTADGIIPEVVVDVDESSLTEIEPAEPDDSEEVSAWDTEAAQIRTD